ILRRSPSAAGLPVTPEASVVPRLHEDSLAPGERLFECQGQIQRQIVSGPRNRRTGPAHNTLAVLHDAAGAERERAEPAAGRVIQQPNLVGPPIVVYIAAIDGA